MAMSREEIFKAALGVIRFTPETLSPETILYVCDKIEKAEKKWEDGEEPSTDWETRKVPVIK